MIYYGCREDLDLYHEVRAEGPVEDWLNVLCEVMQFSVRQETRTGAQNVLSMPLKEFVDHSISQISLLGIQLKWTIQMEEAISRSNHRDRKEELDRKNMDVRGILSELVAMCLEDITDKLKRTKIETLVTIQVH
jgi:dynein heavy chain